MIGGHRTDPPEHVTYEYVFSMDMPCVEFLIVAPNDVGILTTDIKGIYINALYKEKARLKYGAYFGLMKGLVIIITRLMYNLKSSGAAL